MWLLLIKMLHSTSKVIGPSCPFSWVYMFKLLISLIFPSSLWSDCRDKLVLIYTSSTHFSHQHHPLSDRSSCSTWQIGHVISKIPAVLPCSQHFCQRSIWRSNFTMAGTSVHTEHSHSSVYAQYIDTLFGNMDPWWKVLYHSMFFEVFVPYLSFSMRSTPHHVPFWETRNRKLYLYCWLYLKIKL